MTKCGAVLSTEDVEILAYSARGRSHLLTLEALYIKKLSPKINVKDEWVRRDLVITF